MPQEQSASWIACAARALTRSPITRAQSAAARSNHPSPLIHRSSSLPSDMFSSVAAVYGSDGPVPTLSAPPTPPMVPVPGPPSPETMSSLTSMDSDEDEPVYVASTPISPASSVYPTSPSASSYAPPSPGALSYGSSFAPYEDVDMATDTGILEEPQMDHHDQYPYFPSSDVRSELHLIVSRLCEAEDTYLSTACGILTDNHYSFEDSARMEMHLLTARLREAEDDYIATARDISVDAYCLLMELGVN
ncbi:hypothetical protein BDN71DRAFT_1504450 [Pleurotus eryngii]|uniref:Uncharacterized protein n=1 Tax=Pleurotus eryngii TaxID=5323 RepID=A0A9P6A1U3_PLEER|nr:hypothetical protein BDN71DRAFT_1504450 [Pleurotus eryngii]